jgi:STAM-binding protein
VSISYLKVLYRPLIYHHYSFRPIQSPITTTSPAPPHLGAVQYPSLMTQHQISQGYHPSLSSMFHRPFHTSHSGLLLQTPESALNPHNNYYQYPLPKKSQPVHAPYTTDPSTRIQPHHPKERAAPASGRGNSVPHARELKTVTFPRDCLNKFTSIASINTARNRETCGLLLGKDRGKLYVVTTLLIPKQHSTSDTCAMDEEELVMQFTEERSLITLGWVRCPVR